MLVSERHTFPQDFMDLIDGGEVDSVILLALSALTSDQRAQIAQMMKTTQADRATEN